MHLRITNQNTECWLRHCPVVGAAGECLERALGALDAPEEPKNSISGSRRAKLLEGKLG
jgi:hypothetical protein